MWKTLFAGAAVLCIVIVGGGYAYRQHEISAGIASYQKGDFQDAYSILHPFSGWGDPTAQGILADIDLKEKASSFFMSGSQRASANAGGTGGIGVENDQEALDLATDSAKAGNAFGEFVLSMIYMNGWSVNENDKEAFSWAQQSAQQGSALAAMELGTLYQFGTGVPQDSGQANTYFQQALAAGVWQADDLLGFNYASGEGVPQDAAKSVSYYQDAANHGDDTGEFNLGDDYLTGTGVTQDVTKAQPLLLAAAEQGNSGAMSDLGTIFSKGDASAGYPSPDLTLAYMFYDLAIANGDKGSAGDDKSQLAQSMTPDQVASGQAMASSWIKGKPFPSSSYEDFAAQAMYQAGHTDPSIIQNTNVWFSISFTFEGKKLKVVFLKVKIPNGANSDGAKISIVTFDASKPPGLWYISKPIQLDYFETGMMGDVSINPDLSKSFDDPKRANVVTYQLGQKYFAVLVPEIASAQGDVTKYYDAFIYSSQNYPQNGSWTYAHTILTGEDNTSACGPVPNSSLGCSLPGYSWSGTTTLIPPEKNGGALQIVVHATGTEPDYEFHKLISAEDLTSTFDGTKFHLTNPTTSNFYFGLK